MTEPAEKAQDTLEADVDAAIALCDGDIRAALRAALVYNDFLERKLDTMRGMVSSGYTTTTPRRTGFVRVRSIWRRAARTHGSRQMRSSIFRSI